MNLGSKIVEFITWTSKVANNHACNYNKYIIVHDKGDWLKVTCFLFIRCVTTVICCSFALNTPTPSKYHHEKVAVGTLVAVGFSF